MRRWTMHCGHCGQLLTIQRRIREALAQCPRCQHFTPIP